MTDENTKLVAFRCPEDIRAAVSERMEAMGQNRTEAILDMLRNSVPSVSLLERQRLPDISAIYVIHAHNRVLYVGRSKNLRGRFIGGHHRLGQFLQVDGAIISWFECPPEDLVNEADFIELLGPELNGSDVVYSGGAGELVQFRLSPSEIEALKEYSQGESNSLTAKALILKLIKGDASPQQSAELPSPEMVAERVMQSTEFMEILKRMTASAVETRLGE